MCTFSLFLKDQIDENFHCLSFFDARQPCSCIFFDHLAFIRYFSIIFYQFISRIYTILSNSLLLFKSSLMINFFFSSSFLSFNSSFSNNFLTGKTFQKYELLSLFAIESTQIKHGTHLVKDKDHKKFVSSIFFGKI